MKGSCKTKGKRTISKANMKAHERR